MQFDLTQKITALIAFLLTFITSWLLAPQFNLAYLKSGDVQINSPESAQVFYDELKGNPRNYYISFDKDFDLYINLRVPEAVNPTGKYSAAIFLENGDSNEQLAKLDGETAEWKEFYDEKTRDYYLKGPEITKQLSAGKYKIEISSKAIEAPKTTEAKTENEVKGVDANQGKYVLAVGKKETLNFVSLLNICWQLPILKSVFLKTSVLQFFFTPFAIAGIAVIGILLIILALINYLISLVKEIIRHSRAKTLLLTSSGMQMREEIVKLLQKPAYDITVAFISTAAKPLDNLDFLKKDWTIMRDELGFNVEEVDIDGKRESEVMKLIEMKDIIFVEGGNAFYLLNAMRKCNFERIMRKLLKEGKVYIGSSAGSIVAGRTIKTAEWLGDNKKIVKFRGYKGLNLVPFDVFPHYQAEYDAIIKKKLPFKWQRRKLKIITDEQAVLVQDREVMLIGKGDAAVI